jgi:hypothetical protein
MARKRLRWICRTVGAGLIVHALITCQLAAFGDERDLSLSWDKEMLTIHGKHLPGAALDVWYIEAFCRPGSTRRDWAKTVIPHRTERLEASPDGRVMKLRSRLDDGVVVEHEIRTERDAVDFRVVATNPSPVASQVHWAQPCIRVDRYAGTKLQHNSLDYLRHCFIEVDGQPARLPTTPWALEGIYTPGQVWCPKGVSRDDVNPRPLSSIVPSSGLIGCISADGNELVATAWEPYQELFQGVIVCLHSDFRIGGLKPGETKTIRGKIYLIPADLAALQARYRSDFPGQVQRSRPRLPRTPERKLIEFGWDEPDTGFLRLKRQQLEQSPFDGCVFHVLAQGSAPNPQNFTWLCWGRRRFSNAELGAARADLESLAPERFHDNFLRFNVTPGDIDWFEDFASVTSNAFLAAQLARAGRCRGILLDTEQYQGKLFEYRKQREAANRSWPQYAAQARLRGREVMTAFQDGYPGLTVLVTFGPSLVWKQSDGGTKALAECPDGLLIPFFDGMIEAVRGDAHLVDGHELSYGYCDATAFAQARETIKSRAAALAADRPGYARKVSAAFGLWLDFDWPKYGWDPRRPDSNYFSPERFEHSLRAAVEQTDEFVWIYTEKPRWWSEQNGAIDLPQSYIEAVRRVRRALSGGR